MLAKSKIDRFLLSSASDLKANEVSSLQLLVVVLVVASAERWHWLESWG